MQKPVRVLEIGTGYACSYAGWVLAGQGAKVSRAIIPGVEPIASGHPRSWIHQKKAQVSVADLDAALRETDLCITDRLDLVPMLAAPAFPRPAGLERVAVVEIGSPAAEQDAEVGIAAGSGVGAAIGEPDGPALAPPGHQLEGMIGLHAASAGLAAVVGARRDGVGEHVFIDPCACIGGIAAVAAIQYLNYGGRLYRDGRSAYLSGGPYPNRIFRASDGWIVVICRSKDEWAAFLELLGHPTWASEPRYQDQIAIAKQYADEVTEKIEAILAKWTVADLWVKSKALRVPLAPLRSLDDVRADPNLIRPGMGKNLDLVSPIDPIPNPRRPGSGQGFNPVVRNGRQSSRPPLAGLKVIDLGWVWAAPIAAAWLGDLGADVVKVESIDRLDVARRRGIEFPVAGPKGVPSLPPYERAHLFAAANRNKRSVSLNLKDPADYDRFLQLVGNAHVLIESFSGGVLERMNLGVDRLFAANPNLIVVSLGGATVDGSYVGRSYAPILSALAGLESAVRDSRGDPLGMMSWGGADPSGGSWALLGVIAALANGVSGVQLSTSQLRGIVNTCASLYYEGGAAVPITDRPAEEITAAHIDGTAAGPLGDIFRRVTVRSWDPTTGERVALGNPWRFRRMSVGVRQAAPLFGNTDYDTVIKEWRAG
ncbi:MAG: CoA transferase [Alphaproteobacteria bacterium]